jgi:formylmethanofuran--tetrahydromethanopterin N-formyltransferase
VINGIDAPAIARAMHAGITAACGKEIIAISAGNYGGKLGPHHFHLRKIMAEAPA